MKVGIKYCGGCNPRYDRGQIVTRIKEEFGQLGSFEIAKESETYDKLLVIGGCHNCCAQLDHYLVRGEILKIKCPEDYKKILKFLKCLPEMKNGR